MFGESRAKRLLAPCPLCLSQSLQKKILLPTKHGDAMGSSGSLFNSCIPTDLSRIGNSRQPQKNDGGSESGATDREAWEC